VADRLGLGYGALRELRPDLVYCSITGFGSGREPEGRAGYDFVVQAESGLMSITGDRDGPPMKVGVAVVDVLTGLHAASGILAALHARERTGEGRRIEVSLLDSALASLVNVAQGALLTGREAGRFGNAHPSIVPYEPLRATDGWVAVAAANDSLWRALCAACERPDLLADERFGTNPDRVAHREELIASLAPTFASRSADEWLERLEARGVPAGKIRGVGEALGAAAAAGRAATLTVEHPTAGTVELVAGPIALDPPSAVAPAAPPLLGQHTLEVLAEAGVDGEALVAAGVAAQMEGAPAR
jgi:crotonobetainyl-CoA:carnitine CoA-transferase CaiB-like acyl-CoA transferase